MSEKLTDPYGALEYAVGSGDDFVCFDYHVDEDRGAVLLHAVLNSETGHFIQDFEAPEWYPFAEAPTVALRLTEAALDWCADNDVRHTRKGWNQDAYYFVRCVVAAIARAQGAPYTRVPRTSKRQPLCTEK
jgi:hypothetical protein